MRFKLFIFCLFVSQLVLAGNTIELTEGSNIRSTENFYGQKNVIGYLPQGSHVEVLKTSRLPSGAESYEVKIITPESLLNLNETPPLYIWISNYNEPKAISETEASSTDCPDGSCSKNENSSFDDIKNVTQKIEEQNSQTADSSTASQIDFDQSILNYSNSVQVQTTINYLEKNYTGKRSRMKCYRVVKEALANQTKRGKGPGNNLIPKWFASQKAKNAVTDLKKYGFINLLENNEYQSIKDNPRLAPKGAVLVYQTKHHRWGHIEVKMDAGENSRFGFDMVNNKPITESRRGKNYKLIGVLIKPQGAS